MTNIFCEQRTLSGVVQRKGARTPSSWNTHLGSLEHQVFQEVSYAVVVISFKASAGINVDTNTANLRVRNKLGGDAHSIGERGHLHADGMRTNFSSILSLRSCCSSTAKVLMWLHASQ